jgi:hypothetical protein
MPSLGSKILRLGVPANDAAGLMGARAVAPKALPSVHMAPEKMALSPYDDIPEGMNVSPAGDYDMPHANSNDAYRLPLKVQATAEQEDQVIELIGKLVEKKDKKGLEKISQMFFGMPWAKAKTHPSLVDFIGD